MRVCRMLVVVLLGAWALAAHAGPPSGAALGRIEATLGFCTGINPDGAELYRSFASRLTGGATEQELAAARKGAEYRAARASTTEQLGKVPKQEAAKACAEGLGATAE